MYGQLNMFIYFHRITLSTMDSKRNTFYDIKHDGKYDAKK